MPFCRNFILTDDSGTITDIIYAEDSVGLALGGKAYYFPCSIGEKYNPPKTELEELQAENKLLKAQLQAQSDRSDFIEDCIAEMAVQVYGGV